MQISVEDTRVDYAKDIIKRFLQSRGRSGNDNNFKWLWEHRHELVWFARQEGYTDKENE